MNCSNVPIQQINTSRLTRALQLVASPPTFEASETEASTSLWAVQWLRTGRACLEGGYRGGSGLSASRAVLLR